MNVELLDRHHPCVDEKVLAKYRALFEGGEAFKREHWQLAPKLPGESDDHYKFRRERLRYRSYVGAIIWFFTETLFHAPMKVKLHVGDEEILGDPLLGSLQNDADGKGCPLASIAQSAFLEMSRDGWSWLHLEREEEGIAIESECAAEVINWQQIGDELAWVVERECSRIMATPYEAKATIQKRWDVYDPLNKTVWAVQHLEGEQCPEMATMISQEPHGFLQVPFVAMRPAHGLFLMGVMADTQLEQFNISNAHSFALNLSAYPTAVYKRKTNKHTPKISPGGLTEIEQEESLDWIAPPAAPFEALEKREKVLREELYRVAHQLAHGVDNNAAAIGRSAESKEADNAAMVAALKGYGRVVREAVESALQIAVDATRTDGARVSVEGLDEFDSDALARALNHLKTALDVGIESSTLIAEMRKTIAHIFMRNADEATIKAVETELEAAKLAPRSLAASPAIP